MRSHLKNEVIKNNIYCLNKLYTMNNKMTSNICSLWNKDVTIAMEDSILHPSLVFFMGSIANSGHHCPDTRWTGKATIWCTRGKKDASLVAEGWGAVLSEISTQLWCHCALGPGYHSYTNKMHACIIPTNHRLQFLYLFHFMFCESLQFSLSLPCLLLRLLSVPTVPSFSPVCSF